MALIRNKPRVYSNVASLNSLPLHTLAVVFEGSALGEHPVTGRVRPLCQGDLFAGFAKQAADTTNDAAGQSPTTVNLVREGEVELAVAGVTAASIGASVFATDDDTFVTTSGSLVGEILRVPTAGVAVVGFAGGVLRLSAVQQAVARATLATDAANVVRRASMTAELSSDVGTFAHTRATANASVVDCYGSMQFAFSGERRHWGARRVANMLRFPETLTNATYWSAGASTSITALTKAGVTSSRKTWFRVARTTGSGTMLTYVATSYRPGKWVFSCWVIGDGVQTYTLAIGASTQAVTPEVGVPTRIAVAADITSATAVALTLTNTTSGVASFDISEPQMEWAHGQASPAPADYICRDVTSYPSALLKWGADGVYYADTVNPWTLSSGIATRTGAVTPIEPSLLLGMQFDPISTNQVYDSRDISQSTWAKTGTTTVNATAGDSTLLGIGSLRAMEEAATAGGGWRVTQSWRGTNPSAGSALSVSFFCKKRERTIVYIGLRQLDGSTFTYAYFDLVSGTVSNVSSGCTAYMLRFGDLWRVFFTGPAGSSGSTAPLIQVGMAKVAGTQPYDGTLGEGAWFGAIQFEASGCPTTYIGDTASASTLSRNADSTSVTFDDMPHIDLTIAFEVTPWFPTDTPWKDSWWYALSRYVDGRNRNAIGWRPNTFGGAGSGMEDEWFFDLYPDVEDPAVANGSSWDGVEILAGQATVRAGETALVQWALAPDGRTSGTSTAAGAGTWTTNQVARVGNVAATLTSDTPRPTINAIPPGAHKYWIGKQGEFLPQRGSFCLRNLSWRPKAITAAQMAELSP